MARELWEIVRADELKVGDVVHFGRDVDPMEIDYVRPGPTTLLYRCVNQDSTFWEDNDAKLVRRYTGPSPDVLMRALGLAVEYMSGNDKAAQAKVVREFIADAEAELAKEREA